MDVLVTGGTGFIGTHLCRELADRGHDVTALSRTPDGADLPDGVATATGDVTAYDSIEAHFEGRDAVVNLVALSPLFKPKGGDERHFEVHFKGTQNVVAAAEEHGVRKLVQMSGVHADPDAPTAYLAAKGRAEQAVRDADLAWTVLRPTVVFGDGDEFQGFVKLLTTPVVTALPGADTPYQLLWVGDLVAMVAEALDGAHDGETYELGGPEELTLAEITRLVYRAEGKSVTVIPVPLPLAGVGLTLADPLPFVPFGRDQYRSLRDFELVVAENDAGALDVETDEMRTFGGYLGV
ncbi:MAG: complex I NDUFA9 subunit family protein [Halobacteriaceae archaeon]